MERAVYGALANALAPLYAAQFQDMSAADIVRMHREAFAFENCTKRQYLIDVISNAL